ncbi:MAG: hypothetical protein ACRD1V_01475 [Vicinamibacterales bacterium]
MHIEPNSLAWHWIELQAVVPLIVALLIAYPFWHHGHAIFGNLTATVILFGAAFGLIMRERIELDRISSVCLDKGYFCFPEPPAFTRFAVYSCIALVQVFLIFYISIRVEERQRGRGYAPEWRR